MAKKVEPATTLTKKQQKALRDRLGVGMGLVGILTFILVIVQRSAVLLVLCLAVFWILFATWFLLGWYTRKTTKARKKAKRRGR